MKSAKTDPARLTNMTKVQLVNEVRRLLAQTGELVDRVVRAESTHAGLSRIAELEGFLDDAIDERDNARAERDQAQANGAEQVREALRARDAAIAECDKWRSRFEQTRTGTLVSR